MPTYDTSAERRAPRPAQAPANRTQEMLQTVSKVNSWRDLTNPLRSLTMPTAVSWLENAQHGVFADLMWAYESAIEPSDADLCCIIDRTDSAIRDCEWQVEQISDETKAFDAVLADEQEAFLREVYEGIPNLYDAFGFLAMSKFRGFSIINPWFSPADPLSVEQLHCIPHWNIVRDGYSGRWKYNPDARTADFKSLPESHLIAPEEMIRLETRRPVNRIALVKFVRAMTAEKDWDAYVEIYGIPGVFIVAPDNIGEDKIAAFQEAAEAAANQASGALPSGSQVITTQEARSNQPFQPRLEWLQKQLVLAGTGGLLTVLAESGSGTLAGSVHEQAFRQIGRGLARRITEAFQRQLDKPLLTRAFPGKPVQAYFELKARQEKNVGDFVAHVVQLAAQGYKISAEQVAQETGYDIAYEAPAPAAPPFGAARMRARGIEDVKLQSEDSGTKPESANLQSSISSLQSSTPSSLRTIQATFARLATMAADPAISDAAIQAEADAAIAQFPELLPDLASAIARPMAMDMAQAAVEGAVEGIEGEDAARSMHFDPGQPRDENGRWSETGGGGMEWTNDAGTHHSYAEDTLTITPKGKSSISLDATTEPRPLVERMAKKMKDAGRNPADYRTLSDKDGLHVPATELDRYDEVRRRGLAWKASPDAKRRQLEAEVSNQYVAGDHPTHPRRMKMAEAEKKLKEFDAANPDAVQREIEKKQKRLDKRAAEIKPGSPWTN